MLAYLLQRKGSLKVRAGSFRWTVACAHVVQEKKVLVFTRTRQRSVRLVESLQTQFNISAAALHGELSFAQQQSVVEGFTSGSTQVHNIAESLEEIVDVNAAC